MYEDVKKEILDICLQMVENDLVIGSSGNVSVRIGDHVVITPSSVWYTEMAVEDMVVTDLTGKVIEGERNPSVESLPPLIDETVPKLGSDVKVTKYHMPGTKELGIAVVESIKDRSAALIANHGAVCIAKTLKKALHLAILLERTCKIYTIAKMSGGEVHHLPEDVVEDEQDVWEMMSGY